MRTATQKNANDCIYIVIFEIYKQNQKNWGIIFM